MKPCLVNTSQGFSILYKEKYLYSKYNPSKAIIQKINELNILPGTIFLCFSPVLSYGLKELLQKIPENCLVIACEFDKELYSFAKDLDELKKLNDEFENFVFPDLKEVYNLPIIINSRKYLFNSKKEICFDGKYKRIVSVDFSAGVQFNQSLYSELEKACVNSIKTFWTNRITLTKFGRKYSRNLFKNLINHAGTNPIENYFKSVNKPIIVLGAGESFAESIKYLENPDDYFIICADTAFQPLLKNQIVPDAVFIEEAQNVILKAFIGTQNQKTHFFAGLSSIPQLKDFVSKDKISYFASIYSDSEFLENLQTKEFFPYANKPFGSVGLTSVFYAIKFRQDENVPIILDDPTNSLDNKIINKFASRLLSFDNQIIIFTHYQFFLNSLNLPGKSHFCKKYGKSTCGKQNKHVYVYEIDETLLGKGNINEYYNRDSKTMFSKIENDLPNVSSGDLKDIPKNMRKCIEYLIDEVILKEQLLRKYNSGDNIEWEKLKEINPNNKSLIVKLHEIHGRVSGGEIHVGMESNENPPTPAEIQSFLDELKSIKEGTFV